MGYTKITENVENIAELNDTPVLTPANLKKEFDEGNKTIKEKFNTLVDDLDSNSKGKYIIATVGTNDGEFKIDGFFTLETNDLIRIKFPISTITSQAKLSVDNGTNYYDITGATGKTISDRYHELVYNGTNFLIISGDNVVFYEEIS